jgi:hypothetical protein
VRERERDRAGTGSEVEGARLPVDRHPQECELDQRLGLGPRDQHGRRHAQRQSPELAHAGEIGDGLAVAAALREREECRFLPGGERLVAVRDEPRAVPGERVRHQDLRIEGNEARLRKRPGYRLRRAHGGLLRLAPCGGRDRCR